MKSIKYSKLSDYKIKKIIECFSLDLTADQSSKLLKLNRKTINKYYMHFRELIFERGGRVLTEIIPDAKGATLRSVIRGKVSIESVLYTDGWRGYDGLVDIGYGKHMRINKKVEGFVNDTGVHINGIESFWSHVKRRLSKFNGVKRYFEYHLKECEWRWKKDDKEIAGELWQMIKEKKKTY